MGGKEFRTSQEAINPSFLYYHVNTKKHKLKLHIFKCTLNNEGVN